MTSQDDFFDEEGDELMANMPSPIAPWTESDDEQLDPPVNELSARQQEEREVLLQEITASPQQAGGGQFRFALDSIFQRQSATMGVHERVYRARLQQHGTLNVHRQNISRALAQGMQGAIEQLLDDPDIADRDRIFVRFHTSGHDTSFARGMRAGRWRQEPQTMSSLLDDLAQKLNSGESYDPDEPFQLEFVHVRAGPQGRGWNKNRRPGYESSAHFRLNKKCIVNMPKDDAGLCCVRAIVTARGLHLAGNNHNERHKWTAPRKCLHRRDAAAQELLLQTGLQQGSMGLKDIDRLAQAPSLCDYRIVVIDANRQYACFAFGEGDTLLGILHEDEHFDTVTTLPGFFGRNHFCGRCLKPYDHQGRHNCAEGKGIHCPCCQQDTCEDYVKAYLCGRKAHYLCRDCQRFFHGDGCLTLHQTKAIGGATVAGSNYRSVCESWKKCRGCHKLLKSVQDQQEHRCGFGTCPSCREEVDLKEHRCFVQVPRDPEILEHEAQIVQINLRRRRREELRKKGLPVPACLEGEDYRPQLLVFWDSEAMQNTGIHVPNLVVGMTAEDNTPCLFADETCIDRFLDWLEQLTEQDTRYVTVIAHNFKGYDSYFIVPRLIARKQTFKPTYTGGKLLELTFRKGYIRFIDSLSFLTMPLASFTSTFDLNPDEFAKGHFPHLFNTPENATYVGDLPPKEMYCPDTMSTKGKAEFEQWYDEQVTKGVQFDMQRDLRGYCISDVKLLRAGCLAFDAIIKEQTGFSPFTKMTAAGVCIHDLRLNCMEEDTIASKPLRGWRLATNHSKEAMEWLQWQEHRLQAKQAGAPRIRHARNQGEYQIPGTRWSVDGYDETTNTAYEYHGCFWHGCPTCFPNRQEPYRRHDDRCMDAVYQDTMARLVAIRAGDIHVISIWGCQWSRLKKEDPQIKAFVDALTIVPPMNPRDAFFGGRTNAVHLYYKIQDDERIFYIDYMSLYPWTNKYAVYPVGHPDFIYNPDTTDLSEYFGLVTCTILPPTRLFHPVLPYRCSGKLTFPLCRTCVEQDIDKALHDKSLECTHTDAERALTWTWCTPELEKAVEVGYVILKTHEVAHFPSKKQGLFESYVNRWLKLKVEASGWPAGPARDPNHPECQIERDTHVSDFARHEGIQLEPDNIKKNPGLRACTKMMLNSMWGKFGQRDNLMQHKLFFDPQPFQMFMDSDQHDVRYVSCLDEHWVEVHYKAQTECEDLNVNTNEFVAAFTTCWARLRLYEALERLGKRVLYFDTDSIIGVSRPGEPDETTGTHLGEFTNELGDNQFIREFCSGGPKNYGYLCNDGKTECKVKGHSLNVEGKAQLNYNVLRQNTLDELCRPLDTPRKTPIHQARKIVRRSKEHSLHTQPAQKNYQLVYNKRVLRPGTAITYPYGYSLTEEDSFTDDRCGFASALHDDELDLDEN